MMQNETPIILKTYDFYKILHETIRSFSREEKYTLGEEVKDLTLSFFELLIEAEHTSKGNKLKILEQASIKLDLLKLLIRMCFDLKLVNQKKYIFIEEHLQEIGKMLGGWIKSNKNT